MKHLWILNRESGICLFEQQFTVKGDNNTSDEFNSDLFTGFVSAIFSFARVVSGSTIERMVLADGILYYRVSDLLVVVVLADKKEIPAKIKRLLTEIEQRFLNDYKMALETNIGDDVAIFKPFGETIQQILQLPVILTPSDRTEDLSDTLLRLMHKQISIEDAYQNILGMYEGAEGQENTQLANTMGAIGSLLKHVTVEQRLKELVSKLEDEMAHWGTKAKLFVFGLDKAGKTAILNRLRGQSFEPTRPTLSVDVEQFEKEHLVFQSYDLAGQASLRNSWLQYLPNSNGLIFVIDYSDPGRFKEAFTEFTRVLGNTEARILPILIYANKKDIYKRFEIAKFATIFDLRKLLKNPWKVMPCSAKTGEGLEEGLKWLVDNILAFAQQK
ncbi:MAG: small GTP-binding protein [Promethearchaeota archaeon CR_4]|nr:MAG: small GTP-binding protein [Candidatus Lokiarchaeota archaeon CR_4]